MTLAACSTTWRTSWMPCWSEGRQGPPNLRAYVGTRAQRSTTPPAPPPSSRPLCTAVPSRTSRPSGFAQRRRYLRIVLTDSASALAGLPLQKQKIIKKIQETPEETKHHGTAPRRLLGLRESLIYVAGGRSHHARVLPAPRVGPNVAQALPGAVTPAWRLRQPRVTDGVCWWSRRRRIQVGKSTWVSFLLFQVFPF